MRTKSAISWKNSTGSTNTLFNYTATARDKPLQSTSLSSWYCMILSPHYGSDFFCQARFIHTEIWLDLKLKRNSNTSKLVCFINITTIIINLRNHCGGAVFLKWRSLNYIQIKFHHVTCVLIKRSAGYFSIGINYQNVDFDSLCDFVIFIRWFNFCRIWNAHDCHLALFINRGTGKIFLTITLFNFTLVSPLRIGEYSYAGAGNFL